MTMNMIVRCLVVLSVAHAIELLTIGGAAAYDVEQERRKQVVVFVSLHWEIDRKRRFPAGVIIITIIHP